MLWVVSSVHFWTVVSSAKNHCVPRPGSPWGEGFDSCALFIHFHADPLNALSNQWGHTLYAPIVVTALCRPRLKFVDTRYYGSCSSPVQVPYYSVAHIVGLHPVLPCRLEITLACDSSAPMLRMLVPLCYDALVRSTAQIQVRYARR